MMLYRDLGFISQDQYELVDSKCANQGPDLPDDCKKLLDDVPIIPQRSTLSLMDSISTTHSSLAIKTKMETMREFP